MLGSVGGKRNNFFRLSKTWIAMGILLRALERGDETEMRNEGIKNTRDIRSTIIQTLKSISALKPRTR